jgi:hypothetical protein
LLHSFQHFRGRNVTLGADVIDGGDDGLAHALGIRE